MKTLLISPSDELIQETRFLRYEPVNPGVVLTVSLSAPLLRPGRKVAPRVNRHVQLQTHPVFIHLLIMWNWSVDV